MINFNTSVGEYELQPIIIFGNDQALIDQIRAGHKLGPNAPITYKTDDNVKNFEIFRMTEAPSSYADFKNNLISFVFTKVNGTMQASAAAYLDLITSNTVYYYMFRSVDYHGYTSNPSSIYKVELVQADGAVYPRIEIYDDFKIFPTYQFSRPFNKLLSIVPQYTQATVEPFLVESSDPATGLITPESIAGETNVKLGLEESKLFGENFKIRLVSRKTGRKIDFNLSFKIKQPV
jgi:hypothetical protein